MSHETKANVFIGGNCPCGEPVGHAGDCRNISLAAKQLAQAFSRIQRRAAIFEYPIREMQERGWIAKTDDTEELERELCLFSGASSVSEIPNFPVSVR